LTLARTNEQKSHIVDLDRRFHFQFSAMKHHTTVRQLTSRYRC